MELKLDRKEIELILLTHVNRLMPEAGFNRVEFSGYFYSATFDHTEIPQESEA